MAGWTVCSLIPWIATTPPTPPTIGPMDFFEPRPLPAGAEFSDELIEGNETGGAVVVVTCEGDVVDAMAEAGVT
ncbi:hypothetical protein F5884DRAFT_861274 [Xylogone sp. PMI_703]|nr:hypothetical protein F5884DRAFT_861274 [Xylogone sp. PMI_703]